ncbi:hypothetical protein BHM03_00021240, partial [Ensete ventricosum]
VTGIEKMTEKISNHLKKLQVFQSCMSKFFFSVLSLIKEMCCRISGKLSMMTTGRWLKEQCLQVFMDMAVLVEAQEDILDNIESQVFKIYIMLIDER